jgi:uncharacterized protein YbaP (TraB family)
MTIRERVFVLATSRIGQACLALLATVPSVWGGSSVWEVGSGVNSVYIAGAVNVLQETDYPLPAEYYAAYADSSRLVFEVDASEKMDPGVGGSMMRMGLLEGKTLDKVLSKDVYRILEKYCKEAGLLMERAKHYRPSHVIGALFLNAKKELEVFQHGAETHFYLQAVQNGKKLGYLETIGEQVEFLVSLEGKDDNGYVMHSLAELDKLKEHYEDTFTAWKFGDIEYFDRHYIQGMKEAYPELHKTVVVDRNLKWMSKILPAFRTPEKEFFLVGISHLAGEDGILESNEKDTRLSSRDPGNGRRPCRGCGHGNRAHGRLPLGISGTFATGLGGAPRAFLQGNPTNALGSRDIFLWEQADGRIRNRESGIGLGKEGGIPFTKAFRAGLDAIRNEPAPL